jgi:hypothetical protein
MNRKLTQIIEKTKFTIDGIETTDLDKVFNYLETNNLDTISGDLGDLELEERQAVKNVLTPSGVVSVNIGSDGLINEAEDLDSLPKGGGIDVPTILKP